MPQGSDPIVPAIPDTIAPEAHQTWAQFCLLVDAFENAANLGDATRCNQIWIPLQAANSDLMSYYQSLMQGLMVAENAPANGVPILAK